MYRGKALQQVSLIRSTVFGRNRMHMGVVRCVWIAHLSFCINVACYNNYVDLLECWIDRLFDIDPDAAKYFNFRKLEVFRKHARSVVLTVTAVVGLMEEGDTKTLVALLKDLGSRHLSLGLNLKKPQFDLMGQALLDTLMETLGPTFTEEVRDAWVEAYEFIAEKMMQGVVRFEDSSTEHDMELSTWLVVKSWSKVTAIEEYDEVGGELLFKRYVGRTTIYALLDRSTYSTFLIYANHIYMCVQNF
jgi:hemoglobin-like flavoprotein